jgi:hypothetical protein
MRPHFFALTASQGQFRENFAEIDRVVCAAVKFRGRASGTLMQAPRFISSRLSASYSLIMAGALLSLSALVFPLSRAALRNTG